VADVRQLDFGDNSIELIISNSTLDHFQQAEDIDRSLAELARVLVPGGLLLVTMDNPLNPVIALRNRLPKSLLGRTALAPVFRRAHVFAQPTGSRPKPPEAARGCKSSARSI